MELEINSCDNCTKTSFNLSEVPVLNKEHSYNDFFNAYMLQNVPCIIKDVTSTWEANSQWLMEQKVPNLEYLKGRYGDCDVTVYSCNERYFNSQQTEIVKFSLFLDKFWEGDCSSVKYLKDWHLKNRFKDDNFYQVPLYFASDWLNEYLVQNEADDYRFVYMGRAGTWTPFHCDVFNSYSWSANVCGRKRWILFPPGEEIDLKDNMGNLPYDVSDIYHHRVHYEITQNSGDAVFIPSGWYHQVWNIEDTISINHNWVNGCNLGQLWDAMEENLKSVKKEIEDCADMDDFLLQCQTVLRASFGMDFFKFYDFLEFIALRRIEQQDNTKRILFHGHILGSNHIRFDLMVIKRVLEAFMRHSDVKLLNVKPKRLLEKVAIHLLK